MGITNEEAIRILEHARLMSGFPAKIKFAFDAEGIEALEMAIQALMQQLRDCKTCKHSDKGNCAGTEECHECMWDSKYEQQPSEDCISREQTLKAFAEKCGGECACCEYNGSGYDNAENCKLIRSMPSVTPQQKMGRWINNKCDKCGASRPPLFDNYCPNCGANMEVEE